MSFRLSETFIAQMIACSQAQVADSKSDKTGRYDEQKGRLYEAWASTCHGTHFGWHPLSATLHNI